MILQFTIGLFCLLMGERGLMFVFFIKTRSFAFMPNGYFSIKELEAIKTVEGQKLKSVIEHYWHNLPANFSFLSWVELQFENETRLTFATDEDLSGLAIVDFFIEVEEDQAAALGGQVLIQSDDVSESALWKSAIGAVLLEVGVVKEAENWYKSTQALLKFENEEVLVEKSEQEEGIVVGPYTM